MKKLFETLLVGGAVAAAGGSILALAALLGWGATVAGELFAVSRLGLVVCIVAGAVYIGAFVDWGGPDEAAKPAPEPVNPAKAQDAGQTRATNEKFMD